MRFTNGGRRRPAGAILAAAAVGTFMLIGTTASVASAQATTAVTARPAGSVSSLPVSAALQRQLRGLYAGRRHLPVSAIGAAAPRSVQAARTHAGTDWAVLEFVPAQKASLSIRVSFQDGASIGLFVRRPGRDWKMVGLGGRPLGCDSRIPAPVRRLWGFGSCPAASPRPITSRGLAAAASGTTADIATVADNEIGVADNPVEHNFGGLDCNPYTAFENASAPDSGCGTNSRFNVQNRSELWCSDFAKWVWSQGGVTSDLSTLNPLSSSFYTWGLAHGESMPVDGTNPQVGDAMVLYPSGTSGTSGLEQGGDHVGIVTAVNSNGTIDVVNGDFLGSSNIQVIAYDDVSAATFAAETEGSGEEWAYVSPQLTATSSSPLASSPVTTYGQQLQVFGRAANDQTYSDAYTPGKSWSGWNSLLGGLADDPTATEYDTSNYGQQMEVFGRAASGLTYSDVYTQGQSWSGWMNIGGNIVSDPVAIQYGNQMHVFGVAASGATYSDVYTPGKSWSGWTSIGGNIVGTPSVVNFGSQLEVFGRAAGGATWSDVYTPGKSWSGWTSIGGNIVGNPIAVQYGVQMQVFGRAASGAIWSDVYTPGKSWSGWGSLLGGLVTDPSAVVYDTTNYGEQMELFGRSADGETWSDVYTPGGSWSGWVSIGGGIVGSPVAVQYGVQMQVFGRGAGGQTYSDVYTPGHSWSGWVSIEGNLLP